MTVRAIVRTNSMSASVNVAQRDACQKVCLTAFAMRPIAPMLHKHTAARRGGPATVSVVASVIFKISMVFSFKNAVQFEPVKACQAGFRGDVARRPRFARRLALVREGHDVNGELMLIPIQLV